MTELASPEVYGIGAVAVALIAALYRVGMAWVSRAASGSGQTQAVLVKLVQENTEAQTKLANAVVSLATNVDRNTKTTDAFSSLLIAMNKHGNR